MTCKDASHHRPLSLLSLAAYYFLFIPITTSILACAVSDKLEGTGQAANELGESKTATAVTTHASPGSILTYAGTGSPKFTGDGGSATDAGFFAPSGVTLDVKGNVYLSTDNRIRKIDAVTGVITTIAGNGKGRYAGDGGLAVDAYISAPKGLAIDAAGNVVFADYNNSRIRMIDAGTGVITTVAGGGLGARLSKEVGDGGPAINAVVRDPMDVAVDTADNIFIIGDQRLRRVESLSGIISTIAGTGQRGLSGDDGPAVESAFAEPEGVAIDLKNNIFIADAGNHRIRKIAGATGNISTLAGVGKFGYIGLNEQEMPRGGSGGGYSGDGGPGTNAKLTLPSDVAIGPNGNVYFADGAVRVRRIDAVTGIISTVVADEAVGVKESGKIQIHTKTLGQIISISVNNMGEIFLADYKNNKVHKVSAVGTQQ